MKEVTVVDRKVGDKVKWTSTGRGGTKTKSGQVVYEVPANTRPDKVKMSKEHAGLRKMFDGDRPRPEKSYFVLVVPGATGKATPVIYWPRAQHLEAA